jgi:NAD(P)-dependent dehydrogenase (short-subunit alcohol dehydrogenase family)
MIDSLPMSGKVALVTGGSSGIGLATASAFLREGAKVVIASRDPQRAQDALDTLQAAASSAEDVRWVQCDVSVSNQVEGMVQFALDTFGRLDYAFNNGGSGGNSNMLHEFKEADWDLTIAGFLRSVFLCMKYELRGMMAGGGGAIVNNSSVDGERAFPWDPAYSAAKHGVLGLTKSTAVQYARHGVRINAVLPGWIKTPPVEAVLRDDPSAEERFLLHQPVGRFGSPDEVAQAVVWLCSDKASLVTGISMPVDGGYLVV